VQKENRRRFKSVMMLHNRARLLTLVVLALLSLICLWFAE